MESTFAKKEKAFAGKENAALGMPIYRFRLPSWVFSNEQTSIAQAAGAGGLGTMNVGERMSHKSFLVVLIIEFHAVISHAMIK